MAADVSIEIDGVFRNELSGARPPTSTLTVIYCSEREQFLRAVETRTRTRDVDAVKGI